MRTMNRRRAASPTVSASNPSRHTGGIRDTHTCRNDVASPQEQMASSSDLPPRLPDEPLGAARSAMHGLPPYNALHVVPRKRFLDLNRAAIGGERASTADGGCALPTSRPRSSTGSPPTSDPTGCKVAGGRCSGLSGARPVCHRYKKHTLVRVELRWAHLLSGRIIENTQDDSMARTSAAWSRRPRASRRWNYISCASSRAPPEASVCALCQ